MSNSQLTTTNQALMCIDSLSTSVGKSFAWLILVLTAAMTYEVFVRYALNAPTTWAFDFSYITYGVLFLMAGAYTLSRNAHVRGDFLYRSWRPRTQAIVDLVLYVVFFLPGVSALVYSGWGYAATSVRFREVSFGFYAYYVPGQEVFANRVFTLLVQKSFEVASNDVLIAVPVFTFMGYIIDRANILDRMFHALQLAIGGMPGALAEIPPPDTFSIAGRRRPGGECDCTDFRSPRFTLS